MLNIQEEIIKNIMPRDNVKETILYKIYTITSRSKEYHKDSYQISYDWLVKNEIYFDELIVNVNDKLKILF